MKKVIICLIIILIIVIGLYFGKGRSSPKNEEKEQEQSVYIEKGDLTIKISAMGLVQPKTKVEVIALKRGRINAILVEEGDQIKKGQILAWMSSEERVALVDTALAGLEEARKSQDRKRIKKTEEELEIAQNTYMQIPIVAPIDGIIILRGVEPNQTVSLDETLFILADILAVVAQVDEVDIGKVKKGQPVNVTIDAFPEKVYQGKVTKIAFESTIVDNITCYQITTDLFLANGELRSGMSANVEIITFQKKDIILIPSFTIKEKKDQRYVWIKSGPDDYKQRFIKIGFTDGKNVEVLSGLSEGEKIVAGQGAAKKKKDKKKSKFGLGTIKDYFTKDSPTWSKTGSKEMKRIGK